MPVKLLLVIAMFLVVSNVNSQTQNQRKELSIIGTVKEKNSNIPIAGAEVISNHGGFVITNALGEFTIKAAIGDVLTFTSSEFETISHTIQSGDRIIVLVEGNNKISLSRSDNALSVESTARHKAYLDSARMNKQTDIGKSIDYIARAIAELGNRGNKKNWRHL